MISFWPGTRGPADFYRFWRRGRLRGDTLHPKAVLEISLTHDLYFLTMVEGANGRKNAHSASSAEKQIIINYMFDFLPGSGQNVAQPLDHQALGGIISLGVFLKLGASCPGSGPGPSRLVQFTWIPYPYGLLNNSRFWC